MPGFFGQPQGLDRRWLAAGLLSLLAGCTTLPQPPSSSAQEVHPARSAPLEVTVLPPALPAPADLAPSPPVEPAPEALLAPSRPAALLLKSRITDFISRRLLKKPGKTVLVPEAAAVAAPEGLVDEKYRLTGEAARELERGHASWYGSHFHGRRTASGENYNKYALTAAHKTLPFGTIVRVRSLALGQEVDVRINDRGPFVKGRVIDVSQAAAEALGLMSNGVAQVSLKVPENLDEASSAVRLANKKKAGKTLRALPTEESGNAPR